MKKVYLIKIANLNELEQFIRYFGNEQDLNLYVYPVYLKNKLTGYQINTIENDPWEIVVFEMDSQFNITRICLEDIEIKNIK